MSRFQTIVFDFDGTIANTLPLIYRSFNAVVAPRIGRELPEAEIRSHFGPPDQVILGRYVGLEQQAAAFDEFVGLYREHHATHVHLYDGFLTLLETARSRGARLGVMTGKSRITATISLQALGIEPLIDVLIAGDDVEKPKPDPEGVLRVLDTIGHRPGEPGAMVGDSAMDIYAGRGSGLTTIGVTWGVPDHDDLRAAGPDRLVSSTLELAEVLGLD